MSNHILAIDQGTSSTRAFIFDFDGKLLAQTHQDIEMIYPNPGWVEQSPALIWQSVLSTVRKSLEKANLNGKDIVACGITNQRETTIVWDKKTGEPVYNAINWQDRRTADFCKKIDQDLGNSIFEKTGLIVDPYFSATKIHWILDNVPNARAKADKGQLLFGTIDTFIIWKLTNKLSHVSDETNASRTMLWDIEKSKWDQTLLDYFNIPRNMLPQVKNCVDDFGSIDIGTIGAKIPIRGVAGDQQAALVGQNCFKENQAKITFGTGCFALVNTGKNIIRSKNKLITTTGYKLNNEKTYVLEGSVFIAGALVQWLRDQLKIINSSAITEDYAIKSSDNSLIFVPALAGLGAPYWQPKAKGAIFGIMRETSAKDVVKAALEGIIFQTIDLLHAFKQDLGKSMNEIRVDGGMANNNWFLQTLANYTNCQVVRPKNIESSVLGATLLAAMSIDVNLSNNNPFWQQDMVFHPNIDKCFDDKYNKYKKAVECVKQFSKEEQ
jgi:glycerol kinase